MYKDYLIFDSNFIEMSEVWQLRFSSGISLSPDRSHIIKTKLPYPYLYIYSLQWRHNEHDGVSNHQHCDCLFNHLFRCRSKKTSKLRVAGLCSGNSPVAHPQMPVTRKMFPFGDVIMCKEQRDPHYGMQYVPSASSKTTCFVCLKLGPCVLQ